MTTELDAARNAYADAAKRVREQAHGKILEIRKRGVAAVEELTRINRSVVTATEAHARAKAWAERIDSERAFARVAGAFLAQQPGEPFAPLPGEAADDPALAARGVREEVLRLFLPLIADQLVKNIGRAIDRHAAGALQIASGDWPRRRAEQLGKIRSLEVEEASHHALAEEAGVPLDWRPDFSPAAFFEAFPDTGMARALALMDESAGLHAVLLTLGRTRFDCREVRSGASARMDAAKRPHGAPAYTVDGVSAPNPPAGYKATVMEFKDAPQKEREVPQALQDEVRRADEVFTEAETKYEATERRWSDLHRLVTNLKRHAKEHQLTGWQRLWGANLSGSLRDGPAQRADIRSAQSYEESRLATDAALRAAGVTA